MRRLICATLTLGWFASLTMAQNASQPPRAGGGRGAAGLQVRAADVLTPDFVSDSGVTDAGAAQSPASTAQAGAGDAGGVKVVAVRGGAHNGKIVVTTGGPIRGLAVEVGPLRLEGAATPAPTAGQLPSVQVRYALPWGICCVPARQDAGGTYHAPKPGYIGLLAEAPLKEFPPGSLPVRRGGRNMVDTFAPLVPVWLTVRVPAGASPGTYSARLTVRAEGQTPVSLPLEVKVLPWTLPAPAEWQTWAEFIQSPDTLAMQYDAPLWSARHWELIARSFRYLREVGNRIVYVPLIARTNMGHAESLVRWVAPKGAKRGAGTSPASAASVSPAESYSYDFSNLDRYLDTAEKEMGKPRIVVFFVWENYMIRKGELATGAAAAHEQQRIVDLMEKEGGLMGKGPAVTVVDEANKTVRTEYLPHYTDAASKALWQPLFAELRQHLAKRGLDKSAMLGMLNDCWPTKAEVQFFKDLAPEMPWVLHAHFSRADAYGLAKVGYRSQVWSLEAPKGMGLAGWRRPDLLARFDRDPEFAYAPLHHGRFWAEYCICGNQRGVGRLGADYWPVVKDKAGVRKGRVWEQYPESSWRNLGIYTSYLGPGADGPQATTRLELFREGLQECEARIAIEKALADPAARAKLGDALARQCEETLRERIDRMLENMRRVPGDRSGWSWTLRNNWQERSEKLFTLAGEVQRRLASN